MNKLFAASAVGGRESLAWEEHPVALLGPMCSDGWQSHSALSKGHSATAAYVQNTNYIRNYAVVSDIGHLLFLQNQDMAKCATPLIPNGCANVRESQPQTSQSEAFPSRRMPT
jgi:hypothetical protein